MAKQINDLNKSLEEQLRLNEKQEKTDNNLKTTDKTIVGAINELFQNVDSGKQLIADAIDVNGITGNSTFSAMGEAIEGKNTEINNLKTELTGKVTPAGTAVASNVLTGKTFMNSSGTLQTGSMLTIDSNMVGWGGNSNNHWMTGEVQVTDASGIGNPCVYFAVPRNHCTNIDFVMSSTPDLRPENIVSGKNILGVAGTATASNLGGCSVVAGNTFLVVEKQLSDSSSLSTSETSYTISSIPQGVVRVNINITTAATVQQGPICNFYHNGQLIAGNITGRRGYTYDNNFDIQIKNGDVFKIDMTPRRTSTNNYCKMKIYFSLS